MLMSDKQCLALMAAILLGGDHKLYGESEFPEHVVSDAARIWDAVGAFWTAKWDAAQAPGAPLGPSREYQRVRHTTLP